MFVLELSGLYGIHSISLEQCGARRMDVLYHGTREKWQQKGSIYLLTEGYEREMRPKETPRMINTTVYGRLVSFIN